MGISVFSGDSALTELIVPQGVFAIKDNFLNSASQLASVTFNGNISSFGTTIFNSDNKLTSIIFKGTTAPTSFGTTFGSYTTGSGITVYYPADGTGYNATAFTSFFPAGKTTFVPVGEAPAVTACTISSVSATQDGYCVDFTITLANDVTTSVQYVAIYNNEKLIAIESVDASATSVSFTTSDTITKARIFVWDSLTNIKPLCSNDQKSI